METAWTPSHLLTGESLPSRSNQMEESVMVKSNQAEEAVTIKTDVKTDQTVESVFSDPLALTGGTANNIGGCMLKKIKTEPGSDQAVDLKQHHNMHGRDCHFKPCASTTEKVSLHGTAQPHPDDVEWEMWLSTAPIKFESDFDQPEHVPRNQTSPTHVDDIEAGHINVKTEPLDLSTHAQSTIQREKSVRATHDKNKPEHTVYPKGLYQNAHVTAYLAENVHGPGVCDKCDARDGESCPHTWVTGRQNTSECVSPEESCGHSARQRTSDRDVDKGSSYTRRIAQGSEEPHVHMQYGTVVTNPSSVKIHTQTSEDDKPYMCTQCDAAFSRSNNLKRHIRTHTGDKPFTCELCNATFTQARAVKYHMRIHTGEKPFVCNQCNAAFTRTCGLKVHMRTHSSDKPYVCKECGSGFNQFSHLKYHIRTHTGERPFICKECNAAFSHSSSLKYHMSIHTGDRPYVCEQCHAAFTTSGHLNDHIRTHTGDKPYVCQQCYAAFAQSSTLKNHMRTHSGEKPYVCTQCDAAFAQSGHLRRHMQKIHIDKQSFKS